MSIISMGFILFILIGLIIYYIIPKKYQWICLLILSYFYYVCSGIKTIVFIVITTVTTFIGAIAIEKKGDSKKEKSIIKRDKKEILLLIIIINFGILLLLKNFQFIINGNGIIKDFLSQIKILKIFISGNKFILPIGISFYMFQSIGYIIDVYRKKYKADRNIFKYALFVSYFPQVLQGPISRYSQLSGELLKEHSFELTRIQFGLQRILWGLFKKLILADRVAVLVNQVFNTSNSYTGVAIIIGILGYSIQLYGDFSGGIDIIMGVSELFGIKLTENFRQPFFSHSVSEFWRRWHITLGTWMKDYIFYPLSLSKYMTKLSQKLNKKIGRKLGTIIPICIADIVIFLIVGLWHGLESKFIAYGLYNGLIIAFSNLMMPVYKRLLKITHINPKNIFWRMFQIIRTFILINFSWYFDIVNSYKQIGDLIKRTIINFSLSNLNIEMLLSLGINKLDSIVICVGCLIWLIISILKEKGIDVRKSISKNILPIRWTIYLGLILLILIFGYMPLVSGGFMYAQF